MSSTYAKPFLTVEEQVDRLVQRGMLVEDRAAAINALERIGYYRLSGYWYPFRRRDETVAGHRLSMFVAGTSFSEVLSIYDFDERLRVEMLQAIGRIEVALRSWVGRTLGRRGAFAHIMPHELDESWTRPKTRTCSNSICVGRGCTSSESDHAQWVSKQRRVESISNEAFVAHIYDSYGEPLPVWVATETMTFETLSRLYAGMKPQDREQIAVAFDLLRTDGNGDAATLSSWIEHLRQTRNYCAHHARLWNRNHTAAPAVPDSAEELRHILVAGDSPGEPRGLSKAQTRLYGSLVLIAYLSARIDESNVMRDRLRDIVLEFADARPERLKSMGFPEDWEQEPIWGASYARDPEKRAQAALLRGAHLLSAQDASETLTVKQTPKERRALLNYYRKKGALLSVPGATAHRYPSFQFDEGSGDANRLVVLANRRLLDGQMGTEATRWEALRWWLTPTEIGDEEVDPMRAVQDSKLTLDILNTKLLPRDDE